MTEFTWFGIASLFAVLYAFAGAQSWRLLLLRGHANGLTAEARDLARGYAAGEWSAWIVRTTFVMLWPVFMALGWLNATFERLTAPGE